LSPFGKVFVELPGPAVEHKSYSTELSSHRNKGKRYYPLSRQRPRPAVPHL